MCRANNWSVNVKSNLSCSGTAAETWQSGNCKMRGPRMWCRVHRRFQWSHPIVAGKPQVNSDGRCQLVQMVAWIHKIELFWHVIPVSLGVQFLMFWTIIVPHLWCPAAHWHSVTSQNTWIFSCTIARMLINVATLAKLLYLPEYKNKFILTNYLKMEGCLILWQIWSFAGTPFPRKYGLPLSLRSLWVETHCIYEKTEKFESLVHKMTVTVCHMYWELEIKFLENCI
jgi:hypothetical protein